MSETAPSAKKSPRQGPQGSLRARVQRPESGRGSEFPLERLAKVGDLVRQCVSHDRIQRMLSVEWQTTERNVRRYIKAFYESLHIDDELYRGFAGDRLREQNQALYEEALRKGDLKAAGQCLDRLARIDAAYAPEKHEHSGKVAVGAVEGDPAELERELAELRKKQGAI